MSVGVSNGPFFSANAVDHSDHIRSVSFPQAWDEIEFTASGATYHVFMPGLGQAELEIEFNDDEAANEISDALYDLFAAKTAIPIVVRRETTAVSQDNPSYSMSMFCVRLPPINWGAGGARIGTARFVLASGGVTKAIA